jgi:hypothetical protein
MQTISVPRNQITVPICPVEDVTDRVLFEQAADPAQKLYLPRYRVAEQTVSGRQRFRISLDDRPSSRGLTVHLEKYPAEELGVEARQAKEIDHQVEVLLRYRIPTNHSGGVQEELVFQDVREWDGGLLAVLNVENLAKLTQLVAALTDTNYGTALIVQRTVTVAIPSRSANTYDPSPYRPGTPGWTGQVGRIAFINTTNRTVSVSLYHPDAPNRVFGTYQVAPGANIFLANGSNIGMDWGIQVDDSDIRIVGLVSDWNAFDGGQIFQTWPERVKFVNRPTAYDPNPYRPGKPGWTGQMGRIAFTNSTNRTVFVSLYHPDAPNRVFGTYQVAPGANSFLADSANIGMDWGIQVDDSDIRIVGLVSDWNAVEGGHVFQTSPDRIQVKSAAELQPPAPKTPLFSEVFLALDQILEPRPFAFQRGVHEYIFRNITEPADQSFGLIRRQVNWKGNFYSYYQDEAIPHVFKYLPHAFKIARKSEAPHSPDMSVQFISTANSPTPDRVTLDYRAVPFVDLVRREAEAQQLRRYITTPLPAGISAPVFEPLLAESIRLRVKLPQGQGTSGQEYTKTLVDLRRDIEDTLTLTLEDFRAIFGAILSSSSLFQGKVEVALGNGPKEEIPFIARMNDLVGSIFDDEQSPDEASGGVRVTLRNAIESPVRLKQLSAELYREETKVPEKVQGLSLPIELQPGDVTTFIVAPVSQIADNAPLRAALDLSGVEVFPNQEALLNALLTSDVTPELARTITVKAFPFMFDPPPNRPDDQIVAILVDFERGDMVDLTPNTLEAKATLHLPLSDYILRHIDEGEYRYKVTVIRRRGRSTDNEWRKDSEPTLYPDVS